MFCNVFRVEDASASVRKESSRPPGDSRRGKNSGARELAGRDVESAAGRTLNCHILIILLTQSAVSFMDITVFRSDKKFSDTLMVALAKKRRD